MAPRGILAPRRSYLSGSLRNLTNSWISCDAESAGRSDHGCHATHLLGLVHSGDILEPNRDLFLLVEHLGLALAHAKDSAPDTTGTLCPTPGHVQDQATDQQRRREMQNRLRRRDFLPVRNRNALGGRNAQFILGLQEHLLKRLDGADREHVRRRSVRGRGQPIAGAVDRSGVHAAVVGDRGVQVNADFGAIYDFEGGDQALGEEGVAAAKRD